MKSFKTFPPPGLKWKKKFINREKKINPISFWLNSEIVKSLFNNKGSDGETLIRKKGFPYYFSHHLFSNEGLKSRILIHNCSQIDCTEIIQTEGLRKILGRRRRTWAPTSNRGFVFLMNNFIYLSFVGGLSNWNKNATSLFYS